MTSLPFLVGHTLFSQTKRLSLFRINVLNVILVLKKVPYSYKIHHKHRFLFKRPCAFLIVFVRRASGGEMGAVSMYRSVLAAMAVNR